MSAGEIQTPASVDETLLEMELRVTPAERLRWLEDTVEELLPWLGLAAAGRPLRSAKGRADRYHRLAPQPHQQEHR